MPRSFRLTTADFRDLTKVRGRRLNTTILSLSIYPLLQGALGPKTAIIVSKKVSPRAVVRNKIERRCRALIRENVASLKKECIYVFQVKKPCVDASYDEMRAAFSALLV